MPATIIPLSPVYHPANGITLLIEEIDHLIMEHYMVLREEGIAVQIENLKHWLEAHRDRFYKAPRLTETGHAWLSDICDSLKFAARKRRMLKPSGDIDIVRSQQLTSTIARLERIIANDGTAPTRQ